MKPIPPPHAAPAPPVKPRPPPHAQNAVFCPILPRQGWARLHDGANNLTQGWPGATQTTPARHASAPSETQTTPARHKLPHFEPFRRDRGGLGYMTAQTTRRRGDAVKLRPPLHPAPAPPVKPRPPLHAAPTLPVIPRPPRHAQNAAFRAILPRQGWARLHDGANNLTQGWPGATQTTPACPKCRISSHSAETGVGSVT